MTERPRYFATQERLRLLDQDLELRTKQAEACLPLTDAVRTRIVAGVRTCYEFSGLPWHGNVLWAASPRQAEITAAHGAQRIAAERAHDNVLALPRVPLRRHFRKLVAKLQRGWRKIHEPFLGIMCMALVGSQLGGCIELAIHTQNDYKLSVFGASAVLLFALWPLHIELENRLGKLAAHGVVAPWALSLVIGATTFRLSDKLSATTLWPAIYSALTLCAVGISGAVIAELLRCLREGARIRTHQFGSSFAAHRIKAELIGLFEASFVFDDHMTLGRLLNRHHNIEDLTRAHMDQAIAHVDEVPEEVRRTTDRMIASRVKHARALALTAELPALADVRVPHFSSFQRECLGLLRLEQDGVRVFSAELMRNVQAYLDATATGFFWPSRDFVVICEPPVAMQLEGSHARRLHCVAGPAMRWSDGSAIYASHGSQVDASTIEQVRSVEQIRSLPELASRRAAIERLGWEQYIEQAGLQPIDAAPDPGNAPHMIELYEAPPEFDRDFRLLRMVNGSVALDGTRRRFVEPVPAEISTALGAAAWQFGCSAPEYLNITRRT